jgi:acetyl esterase/lipase
MNTVSRKMLHAAWLCVPATLLAQAPTAERPATRPVVSERAVPIEAIFPTAPDGYAGRGFLRKPPGEGPFPAVLLIPGGGSPPERLRLNTIGAFASRFLASGYVVAVISHRLYGRGDADWAAALSDALSAVHFLKARPFVDTDSLAVLGCSTGGDVALEVAGEAEVAAAVAEEPATVFLSRIPVLFGLDTQDDMSPVWANPGEYYSAEARAMLRAKLRRIDGPLLIVQGDRSVDDDVFLPFQHEILLPELQAMEVEAELLRYPGQHCFAMRSVTLAGADAFEGIEAFIRSQVRTQPKQIEAGLVNHVPASLNFGRVSAELPQQTLEGYAGTYVRVPGPSFGIPEGVNRVTIKVQGGQLRLEAEGFPAVAATLSAESETVFFDETGELNVVFVRDAEGKVAHFRILQTTFERTEQ